jgi:hypothetical protein
VKNNIFHSWRRWYLPGLFGVFLWCFSCGETRLSGDISSISFAVAGNPFIIEKDIEVPPGKKVVVGPGCVFLFKEFTGLKVRGSFMVRGGAESPVVFTSIRDTVYSKTPGTLPNPFDWNGFFIEKSADSVYLSNFHFLYSVYGIKSQKEDIVINGGLFKSNGQFDLTVNDRIQYIQVDLPYYYRMQPPPDKPGTTGANAGKPLKMKIAHCCLFSTPVFLIAGGVLYYFAHQDYKAAKDAENYLRNALVTNDDKYASMKRQYLDKQGSGNTRRNTAFAAWGIGIAALGAGIILSF